MGAKYCGEKREGTIVGDWPLMREWSARLGLVQFRGAQFCPVGGCGGMDGVAGGETGGESGGEVGGEVGGDGNGGL